MKTMFTIKTQILLIFIGLISHSVSAQSLVDDKNAPLDSILIWLEDNASVDTIQFEEVAKVALANARSAKNFEALGRIHRSMSTYYDFFGRFHKDSVLVHSLKAVEFLKKTDNTDLLVASYRTLAIDYLNKNEINKANEVLFDGIELFQGKNDPLAEANINRTLALVALISEDYERAIDYANLAYPVFEENDDYYKMAVTYLNLIKPYREIGDLDQSQKVAAECIRITEEYVPDEIYLLARALADKGETSLMQGKLDQALIESQRGFDIVSDALGEGRAASYLEGVANVNMAKGNYLEARDQYLFILENESGDGLVLTPLYNKLQECYEKLGDYQKSAMYQDMSFVNQRKMLEDKIKNLEEESLVKYESGKKDQAIAAQQIELGQRTKIQQLSYVIGGLLLILLIGVYYNYKRTKRISDQLRIKNEENELLLKEIHHRVKNNLEIVSGLLELQSAQIHDEDVQKAMRASQNRVQAMGILHQKLYQGTNLGSIEMKDYFLNLSEGVLDSFDADQRVKIELAMENLELDIDTAVPIGLIVNELLTNALKYAFPDDQEGAINIGLEEVDQNRLVLKVHDNGVGFNPTGSSKGTGFGSQLVELLTKQLGGTIEKESADGTLITLMLNKSKAA